MSIIANSNKTTTLLGRYALDMKYILKELDYPKTLDFDAKNGKFNVLNTPDELFINDNHFWNNFNKLFLDKAIERGDDIYLASNSNLYKNNGELTMFGREFEYLTETKGYTYIESLNKMIKE